MILGPMISNRGFKHFEPVPSYGGFMRVYESSAASGPHVWALIECPVDMNDCAGPTKEATVHLTLENAALLRDQLTYLIEHHYQVE
jgi:hypothetical protein